MRSKLLYRVKVKDFLLLQKGYNKFENKVKH